MNRILRCMDMGLECRFIICGKTIDDVLHSAGDHLSDFHKKEFSIELHRKASNAIYEAQCENEIQADRILVI